MTFSAADLHIELRSRFQGLSCCLSEAAADIMLAIDIGQSGFRVAIELHQQIHGCCSAQA